MVQEFVECRKVKEYKIENHAIVNSKEFYNEEWSKIKDSSKPSPEIFPKHISKSKETSKELIDF